MLYAWATEEEFSAWHDKVKAHLGLPRPGINAATGEVDESAQWTNDYTSPTLSGDLVVAYVDDDIASQFSDGLGTPYQATPTVMP